MNDLVLSKPVFISSGDNIDKPLTGYICPNNKRSIIKSVSVVNETLESGYVSLYWRDVNSRMPASAGLYPILISGYIPVYGRLKLLDDYIVIEQDEPLILTTLTETTGYFTAIFSVMEQDLNPDIVTIVPKTVFFQGAAGYDHSVYTVPTNIKSTIRSIVVNNDTNATAYSTALWRDANQVGIGSTINDYVIYKSGSIAAYDRFRGVEDMIVLKTGDSLRVSHVNDVGNLTYLVTILEEEA